MLEHHANSCRDGRYIAANLMRAAAPSLTIDASFAGTLSGATFFAQPLYVANEPGEKPMVIRRYQTPIVGGARIFVASDGAIQAFHWPDGKGALVFIIPLHVEGAEVDRLPVVSIAIAALLRAGVLLYLAATLLKRTAQQLALFASLLPATQSMPIWSCRRRSPNGSSPTVASARSTTCTQPPAAARTSPATNNAISTR